MIKNKRGFTLIEMILAVTLFAIASVSAFQVFSMGLQIWKRTTQVDRQERKLLLALERMGQDVRSAPWLEPESDEFSIKKSSVKKIEYEGSEEKLMIPAVFTGDGNRLGGYGRITYQWDRTARGFCRKVEDASDLYRGKKTECLDLIDGIWKIKFRYWLKSGISGSRSWYDAWDARQGLPEAIQLLIELKTDTKEGYRKTYERTFLIPAAGSRT